MASCTHIDQTILLPTAEGENVCQECVKTGDRWVHLRKCQSCGVVLCCDSSPNKHATQHFRESQHPVVISAEPGERWAWCYVDQVLNRY